MPRRSSKQATVSIPFRFYDSQAFSATASTTVAKTVVLNPANLGNRVSTIAGAWEWWRLSWIMVESLTDFGVPFSATDGFCGVHSVSYDSDYESTTPSSLTLASQALKFDLGGPYDRIRIRAKSSDMAGAIPGGWRHTSTTGSPTDDLTYSGVVTALAATGSVNFAAGGPIQRILITGVIEFKNPVATSLTLRLAAARADASEILSLASEEASVFDEAISVLKKATQQKGSAAHSSSRSDPRPK